MTERPAPRAPQAQIDACAQEPIHIPGSIQPEGMLLVLDGDAFAVTQMAGAADGLFDAPPVLGSPLGGLVGNGGLPLAERLTQLPDAGAHYLGLMGGGRRYHCIAHRSDGGFIVEFEPAAGGQADDFDIYNVVRDLLTSVRDAGTVEELAMLAAREVRRLTGLDRVLVYRFDESWNGEVIGEDGNGRLPSYLGLRFPAHDIPAQARELYRINRLRLIADADYVPVPIEPTLNPATGRRTDLSYSVLRSVSPVHLEYMRNMGTMASMSISLLRDRQLWGLISCHSRDPMRVPYPVRVACDLVGQILSLEVTSKETAILSQRRSALQAVERRMLARMAAADSFVEGLLDDTPDLLTLTGARGAALVMDEACLLRGETPAEADVRALVRWLAQRERQDMYVTDSLARDYPGGQGIKDEASGIIAVPISQVHDSYVIWFRPEVIRTVRWGGDPEEKQGAAPDARLHPRKSFEAWQQIVQMHSAPWHEAEVEAAAHLRSAIVDIVLRKAEEIAAMSQRLVATNKELEAFSYSVSHDLRAPFRHIVGYAQLLKKFEGSALTEKGNRYLDTIVESAISAGTLVDDLLSFSQMGRASLAPMRIDMNALVREVRKLLVREQDENAIQWRIADLPPVHADPVMLRLVLQNLLDNAIKFSRDRAPAVIEVGADKQDGDTVYFVRDNGVGFDMTYVGKLFGVFQRLHHVDEFEGTGIGLANVKRIVERHGGRVWAESMLGEGATLYFALPGGNIR